MTNYEKYQAENRQRTRDRHAKRTEFVNRLKMKPCADCGVQYNPWVMQFDHVRGDKVTCVSRMRQLSFSIDEIKAEVAKCEVVCSNCHHERTHKRYHNE